MKLPRPLRRLAAATEAVQHSTQITRQRMAAAPEADENPASIYAAHAEAEDLPYGVRIAASWSWRLIVIVLAVGIAVWLLSHVSLLVIPLMIAALLAGLLSPVVKFLTRTLRFPKGLSVGVTMVGFLAVIVGGLSVVGQRLANGFASLWAQALTGISQIQHWLSTGPLGLSNQDLDTLFQDALNTLKNNSSSILSGALSWGTTLGHLVTGMLLVLFSLIFLLLDGPRIGRFFINLLPRRARAAAHGAGHRGWGSMVSYVRVQLFVAFIDAVGIGVGALILGVPLALPLGVLVFIGSFIPVIGALVTGAVAVLLALVANGWVNALIMLLVVLFIQQAESHILQPLVMGKAVSLHPLAVVMAVAGGSIVAGIAGALFAVPVLAVANTVVKYISDRGWEHDPLFGPETAAMAAVNGSRITKPVRSAEPAPADLDGEEPHPGS
ncbi:AI-2E family transporter [Arthrobacter sp. AQ5-05]|uniref:AI-2E family transporter n=1 Tax=Arthrobacter sp. AQ5-05 TaxID=2184581 RepID=UPI000DCE82C5|nr:AI-2E family transporter [Arthrobacter sp. AQ5-05]RAX50741.1 AI-2E family transporter [Arthrobacter sp. AQ5-05]